ncbi:synaptotagmin-1 isoform X2 [Nematostella vectensis]|nr:synaptotagmin-1 isoform X2 [Nematostella vectensis]
MIWQNTGVTCVLGLLVFPVLVGVAIGYLLVLLGVTTYRKVQARGKQEAIDRGEYQKIKVVLGNEVIDSSFPDKVSMNVQDGTVRAPPEHVPHKYYYHRLINQTGNTNGYVKTHGDEESAGSEDEDNKEKHAYLRDSRDESDSSLHASMEDNADRTDDEKGAKREKRQKRRQSSNNTMITNSPEKVNMEEVKDVIINIDENEKHTSGLGRLRFALNYNATKTELQVTIIKASDLFVHDNKEGINPYVKISLLPQKFCWQKTRIVEDSPDAVFNESFVISGFSKERIREYKLSFCVVNYHEYFKERYADDVIGEIHFPLSELKVPDDKSTVSLTRWTELRPVASSKSDPVDLGEVCVSLCFRPFSGRLIVTVTKIQGLSKVAVERTDPYIKLSLYCDGVRLSKANTRVKRRTLNPIYNEKFNFNVTADQISHTTVALRVANHREAHAPSLGLVLLGYNSRGSGQEQWHGMLESPSRHIEKWHKILPDDLA